VPKKVLEEHPLTLSEVYKLIKDKMKDKEFPPALNPVVNEEGEILPEIITARAFIEYYGRLKSLSYEDAVKLKEELMTEIDWSKYNINESDVKAIVAKLVDLLPVNYEELLVILDYKELRPTEDDANKILEIIKKYAK